MPRLDAVIFDLDDTLFDHRGAAIAGVHGWLGDQGGAGSDELIDLWFELEDRHVAAWHRGEVGFDEQRRRRLREMLSRIERGAGDDAALDRSFAGFVAHYRSAWRRFEDVEDALALVASAGLPVAVLTNGAELQQHQKLAAVGLSERVGQVYCCDAIGFAKPDPRAYRLVCDALAIPAERTLHVGDRHDLDVVGARAAGLRALHLDRRRQGPHDEPARITSLRQLATHLAGAAA